METETENALILEINSTCDTPVLIPTLLPPDNNNFVDETINASLANIVVMSVDNLTSGDGFMSLFDSTNFAVVDFDAEKNATTATWVYGLITVAATAMLPCLGFAFHPFQKCRWFVNILLFFVAQTTCHVLSMALLVYLPNAIKMDLINERNNFVGAISLVLFSLFLCFNLEIFHCHSKTTKIAYMKFKKEQNKLNFLRKTKAWANLFYYCRGEYDEDPTVVGTDDRKIAPHSPMASNSSDPSSTLVMVEHRNEIAVPPPIDDPPLPVAIMANSCLSNKHDEQLPIINSAAALMYIFAECLVTFVDGFRVGSALLNSGLGTGIAVSFVIFTEETARKIGGVALMRYIGNLTVGQAIGCSLIPSGSLLIGFVFGAFICGPFYYKLLSPWIFAIALAFFLHVCLVTVIPTILKTIFQQTMPITDEQSSILKAKDGRFAANVVRLFVINLGLICGCLISILIAIFAENLPYMNGA